MTTLNPGYYNNTSCSPGSVQMPDSSQNPITLTPVCNPIDKQLINTIISYLISNDIFILNQQTDTQQTPGQFYISNYGKANSFLAKNFLLLNSTGVDIADLKARTHSINSLGDYYGAMWTVGTDDFIVAADNIVLDGQPVLRTDLPSVQKDVILTVDGNGIVNETLASDITTKIPNLQQVTDAGNSTTNTIVQQNATNDFELVPYGQMVTAIAELLTLNPDIITIILDWLNEYDFSMYIKTTEKASQGGVATLGLDGLIPTTQIPQLTLQWICDNGFVTNTKITAADAVGPQDLVTLGQLSALISAGVGTLDQVLLQGNTSGEQIILSTVNNTVTFGSTDLTFTEISGTDLKGINYGPKIITFIKSGVGYNNQAELYLTDDTSPISDRLLFNNGAEGYLITSLDFGHTPSTGISIDADTLDTYHASSFILSSQFPVDVTGQTIGNILVFNGHEWVPATNTGGGSTELDYFAEVLSVDNAVWKPSATTYNTVLKSNLHKNLLLGSQLNYEQSFTDPIDGMDNFLFSNGTTIPILSGTYNVGFSTSGILQGSHNVVFSDVINLSALSNNNFVFSMGSQIGTNVGAINNILMVNNTSVTSPYQFQGSYSTLLENIDISFKTINSANTSFISNNYQAQVGQNDVVLIRTYNTVVSARYQTAINTSNSTLIGLNSFVSGIALNANSYANVAFGTYATSEVGGTQNLVVDRDRQFFVGSGYGYGNLRNAITVWKSGATQIEGVFKMGSQEDNETGSVMEGSLRYYATDKAIEIYRNNTWTKDLQNNNVNDYIAWSKIKYASSEVPSTITVTGGDLPVVFDPGALDLSTGPNAVAINAGEMTIVTSGYYQVHVNASMTLSDCVIDDLVALKMTGSNITQNITVTKTIDITGANTVTFNFSLFIQQTVGDLITLSLLYLTGVAAHNMTPITTNTLVDFVEVKNVQAGLIEDNTVGWVNNLRQMYIRNTSLNNVNLAGETRFKVTGRDYGLKTITVNNDIPIEVDNIPYDNTKRWAVTMGPANIADIVSIDVTRRVITYETLSGVININDNIEFFNPWVNYQMNPISPILQSGAIGTWTSLYIQPSGGWKKNNGTYCQIITGLDATPEGRLGIQTSPDLINWSYGNGGDYLYECGVQPFNNFEVTSLTGNGNPVKTGPNTYIGVYAQANVTLGRIGWMEFDEDFTVLSKSATPIMAPGYAADIYTAPSVVYFNNKWLVYCGYRPSATPSTWKILEMEMDDIKSGVVNVVREVISSSPGGHTWNGKHMDATQAFVVNGEVKLLITGTGPDSTPTYLFSSNRNFGLVHRTVVGSTVTFTVDTRNPIFSNPVDGSFIWGAGYAWANDHVGGGMSTWIEGNIFHMVPTFNASSNTYKPAVLTFDNSI